MRMMMPKKRLMMAISFPPELQRENRLDGLKAIAVLEAKACRGIGINAVGRVLGQLPGHSFGRILGCAVAEKTPPPIDGSGCDRRSPRPAIPNTDDSRYPRCLLSLMVPFSLKTRDGIGEPPLFY